MSFYDKNNKKMKRGKDRLITAKNPKTNQGKAYLAASATVEAAIVIPMYIYAVLAIGYLILTTGIKLRVNAVLYDECRQLSKYAYALTLSEDLENKITDDDKWYDQVLSQGINIGIAQAAVTEQIQELSWAVEGFNLLRSQLLNGNNDIDLVASYSVKNPFDIFGIGKISVTQRCKTAAWLGENGSAKNEGNSGSENKMVYITRNGRVYHCSRDCTYLNIDVRAVGSSDIINERNLNGGKYYECERCHSYQDSGVVYISDYGERFHRDPNCTAIDRDVLTVPLTSVLGRAKCSKCGGN